MRSIHFILLFFAVLGLPFALREWMGTPPEVNAYAPPERTLIIITAHNEPIRREFGEAFVAWYRGNYNQDVAIDYRSSGATDMVNYFKNERERFANFGTYDIDIAWGGGDYIFETKLKGEFLQPLELPAATIKQIYPNPTLAGMRLYDAGDPAKEIPPAWFGAAFSSFGIVYNKDVDRSLGISDPRTWRDLADPKYANSLALADPMRSGSAAQAYMIIVERTMADAKAAGKTEDQGWADGMGIIRQIAANARLFTDSASTVPTLVSTGDAAAGMAIDFYGRSQTDAVGDWRMGYIEPRNATIINTDPIALVRGTTHRELAIAFIGFVLSPEGQRFWSLEVGQPGGPTQTALRRLPVRADAYADMSHFVDKVNPFEQAVDFNKSNDREKSSTILGVLIQFGCIDLLDELRDTRQAILRSPNAAELDAKLGRFPFDQAEALRRQKQWLAANPLEQLDLQREWTAEFREEYRRLREEAANAK